MALTHFIVVKVMGWGDLHTPSTKLHIYIIVGHNRDATVNDRQNDKLANQ